MLIPIPDIEKGFINPIYRSIRGLYWGRSVLSVRRCVTHKIKGPTHHWSVQQGSVLGRGVLLRGSTWDEFNLKRRRKRKHNLHPVNRAHGSIDRGRKTACLLPSLNGTERWLMRSHSTRKEGTEHDRESKALTITQAWTLEAIEDRWSPAYRAERDTDSATHYTHKHTT